MKFATVQAILNFQLLCICSLLTDHLIGNHCKLFNGKNNFWIGLKFLSLGIIRFSSSLHNLFFKTLFSKISLDPVKLGWVTFSYVRLYLLR
jgi:hypothetical protein